MSLAEQSRTAAVWAMALMDEAMAVCGSAEWDYMEFPDKAVSYTKTDAQTDRPIEVDDLVTGALRELTYVKSAKVVIDVSRRVPEIATAGLLQLINDKQYASLPGAARPADALSAGDKLGLLVKNHEDGTVTVVKVFYFEKSTSVKRAKEYCTGQAYAPVFREGPWAVKKALQTLLDRVTGFHISWARVAEKPALKRGGSSNWEVEDDDLDRGIAFINKWAPEDNDMNQQWLFIEKNIKPGSGSPIAGWPVNKVQNAVNNRTKAVASAATVNRSFPLCIFDLHPFWAEVLLPLLFPLLTEYGLLLLGVPGVGKTPLFITVAMAMGRYLSRTHSGDLRPGWRRGKQMDNFNKRVGSLSEATFLDDPGLWTLSIDDLKSFFDVAEESTTQARYTPAKFAKNGVRGLADNEFDADDEPPADGRVEITPAESKKLFQKPFSGWKTAHVMAVLKRSIACIAGKHALYVRLPSKDEGATVHRIAVDRIEEDWLRDKAY